MVFVHPAMLWLLILALLPPILHWRHRMMLRSAAATFVSVLRTLAIVLAVLAVARPVIEHPADSWTRVAVVDVSGSISADSLASTRSDLLRLTATNSGGAAPKLVVFDRAARRADFAALAAGAPLRDSAANTPLPPGSALSSALALAGALIPPDGRGEVLLYTDGLETEGDAWTTAWHLAERGIAVRTTPLDAARAPEVVLTAASAPASAGIGATVDVIATVASTGPASARLIVQEVGGRELSQPCELKGGEQQIVCHVPLTEEGTAQYAVRIESPTDTLPDNNALPVAVRVGPPQRIGVVEPDAGVPAAEALTALLGAAARIEKLTPTALGDAATLQELDALVIADTPADALGPEAQQQLRTAVVDGLGLVVAGGRRAFGAGGYAGTPLLNILPVSCAQTAELRDPSTTLVVIIDTSGSMGGGRVELAKEVARLAMSRLKPHDKVGIVEFYGSKRWAAPIQSAGNGIDIQRALNRLNASGGTVILPAIEEAYYALLNARTRTKHVLVLTDGGVESGAFEPLIRQMADKEITLSSVLVGPGGHSAFLASLAQWGRGRFYTAHDRFSLPEIIVKQPQDTLLAPFLEHPVALVVARADPVLEGVDIASAPPLSGYNLTEARPTADVLLTTDQGQPVLARWQYGLGAVATLSTHVSGDWSAGVAAWPPYSVMWSNLIRSVARPRADQALQINPRVRPGGLEVDIRAARLDESANRAPVALRLEFDDTPMHHYVLDPVEPGRWNALLPGLAPGTYVLGARTTDERYAGTAAVALPPVREVPGAGVNRVLLHELDGLQPVAARRAQELAAVRPVRAAELWPYLTVAALVCLLVHVLVRRLPVSLGYARLPANVTKAALIVAAVLLAPHARGEQPATTATTSSAADELIQRAVDGVLKAVQSGDFDRINAAVEQACQATLDRDGSLDALAAELQEREPSQPGLSRCLALVAARSGDLPLARDALRRAIARSDGDGLLWAELARVEEHLSNERAALAALDGALQRTTDSGQQFALHVRRALLEYGRGDARAGAEALRSAAGSSPTEPPTGAPAGARQGYCAQLAALLGDYTLACELAGIADSGRPASLQSHLFLGHWQLHVGHTAQAESEFQTALSSAELPRDRRFACERLIAAAREGEDLDALLTTWLAAPPSNPEQAHALVELLREMDRADEALAVLRQVRETFGERDTQEVAGLERDAISLAIEAGRMDAAEEAYRTQIEREPDQVDWPAGLARLYLLEDRPDAARDVIRTALDRCDDAPRLMALAQAAEDLGLDELAYASARKAGAKDLSAHVGSVLFEAALVRQRGDADRSLELLTEAAQLAAADDALLVRVAEAFERSGHKARALELFRQIQERTGGEDVLIKVAGLLEDNERYDEARALWQKLWTTSQNAARVAHAQERMLDLASQTGHLAELAIALEEQLSTGQATQRELELLVRIYTTANDPVSAAEILHEFARFSGDRREALQRLARVYLACNQFGRCRAVLEQLAESDPNNATDYIEQIAIVAMERKQPADAVEALERLRNLGPADPLMDEFSAGVLAMAGLYREAAAAYGQVLARQPDRVETLLLWGAALKASGQVARAIAHFQRLAEEADADDLFAVAIDGLLNLDAPPTALRVALRRVYSRIAAGPEKLFLYRLAADLHEALGENAEMRRIVEQSVLIAGEQRGPLLRELMDSAKADGDDPSVIEFGRSLLGLAEELPPLVLLDLGETLLRQGEVVRAAHTFARAAAAGDYVAIQQRTATAYEDADRPADAERVIRLLLITEPDSVPLLVRTAGLNQQLDRDEQARTLYKRALDLMLGRLPTAVQSAASAPASRPAGAPARTGGRVRSTNLDEIAQSFDLAVSGLLQACNTPESGAQVLSDLKSRVLTELNGLNADNEPRGALAGYPRLEKLAELVHAAAFGLRQPDVADEVARALLERFPNDRKLRRTCVQQRLDCGLYSRAQSFVTGDESPGDVPVELAAARLVADPNQLRSESKVPTAALVRALPLLIATGQTEAARSVVQQLGTNPPADGIPGIAPTLIAAGLALDDPNTMRHWTMVWLEASRRLPSGQVLANLVACIRATWNQLDETDRVAVVQRLGSLAESFEADVRTRVSFLALRLARAAKLPLPDADATIAAVAQLPTLSSPDAAELLDFVPPEDCPALLQQIVAARPAAGVRVFLLELGGMLRTPLTPGSAEAFAQLFESAPRPRLDAEQASNTWGRGAAWSRNPDFQLAALPIAELLLRESPDDAAALMTGAIVLRRAGRNDEAADLAQQVLDRVLKAKSPDAQTRSALAAMAPAWTPDELDEVLWSLRVQAARADATVMPFFAQAVILEEAGRLDEAADAYAGIFKRTHAHRIVNQRMTDVMNRTGRTVALARLLSEHLTTAGMEQSTDWRTLGTALCQLYDPAAAMRAVRRDVGPFAPVEVMQVARLAGNMPVVRNTLQRFIAKNRSEARSYVPPWLYGFQGGGMLGYIKDRGTSRRDRPDLFVALADLPFASGDYAGLWRAARPGQRDASSLASGRARNAVHGGMSSALAGELCDEQQRGALTTADRLLATALAAQGGPDVAATLAPLLSEALLWTDPNDADTRSKVADGMAGTERGAQAAAMQRWCIAQDALQGYSTTRLDERLKRLDAYSLTNSADDPVFRAALNALLPTPLDAPLDAIEAASLDQRLKAAAAVPEELVARVRRLVDGDRESMFKASAAALARYYAQAEQLSDFGAVFDVLLSSAGKERMIGVVGVVDCDRLLPEQLAPEAARALVQQVAEQIEARVARGRCTPPVAVRTLCLLGYWCAAHALEHEAQGLLQRATELAGPVSEHWLWLADLARSTAASDVAISTELALLKAELLPVVRLPTLLAEIEQRDGRVAADELAVAAAAYTAHPEVLRRALRDAERRNDQDSIRTYRRRASVWATDTPGL